MLKCLQNVHKSFAIIHFAHITTARPVQISTCIRVRVFRENGRLAISLCRRFTVDNSEYSPEQKDDEKRDCFLALRPGDALDEDQIQTEGRQHDHGVKQLPQPTAQTRLYTPSTFAPSFIQHFVAHGKAHNEVDNSHSFIHSFIVFIKTSDKTQMKLEE